MPLTVTYNRAIAKGHQVPIQAISRFLLILFVCWWWSCVFYICTANLHYPLDINGIMDFANCVHQWDYSIINGVPQSSNLSYICFVISWLFSVIPSWCMVHGVLGHLCAWYLGFWNDEWQLVILNATNGMFKHIFNTAIQTFTVVKNIPLSTQARIDSKTIYLV